MSERPDPIAETEAADSDWLIDANGNRCSISFFGGRFHNTALAAQLIYRASSPTLPVAPPRFYESNETALADLKRMAELENSNG